MTPVAECFDVVHDQTSIPEHAGDAQCDRSLIRISGIHDAVVAQVSPSSSDRSFIDYVVNDFSTRARQHVDRIRSRTRLQALHRSPIRLDPATGDASAAGFVSN